MQGDTPNTLDLINQCCSNLGFSGGSDGLKTYLETNHTTLLARSLGPNFPHRRSYFYIRYLAPHYLGFTQVQLYNQIIDLLIEGTKLNFRELIHDLDGFDQSIINRMRFMETKIVNALTMDFSNLLETF